MFYLYLLIALIVWPFITLMLIKFVTNSDPNPDNSDWASGIALGFACSLLWPIVVPCILFGLISIKYIVPFLKMAYEKWFI